MKNIRNYTKNSYARTYSVDLAYIDDLTNLYNRRYLNATLSGEISKAKKESKKLALFMMDCDNLKDINDTYGHLGGDQVLIEIAGISTKEIGKAGVLVRYAGDEFVVVLPGKELKESLKVADRLLRLTQERKMELKDGRYLSNVTLSIGVAVYPDDADGAEGLIEKADQALYSAKRTGKNKVSTVHDLVIEAHDRNLVARALPCKRFIDREKELGLLKEGYDNARKGKKLFVLIGGEQGVGKTRLMLESFNFTEKYPRFLLKCRRENLDQPFGAISDALGGLLDFLEAREVLSVLESLSDISKFALSSTVDKIRELPIHYSENRTQFIKELHEEDILSAFINFIKGLNLGLMPILVDDILWIDRGSLGVIKLILEGTGDAGTLVVGTLSKNLLNSQAAKGTPFLDFLGDEKLQKILETINLEHLSEGEVSKFLKAIFSGPLLPRYVEKKIFHMSEGFPSNVEEIVKYLIDSEIVYPRRGKWIFDSERLNKVPASLKDLLDKRVSGLDDESREVLSKAAILGNDFNTDFLSFFYGKNEGELLETLDRLRDKDILQQSMLPGESALSFVNDVIRQRIYNTIEKRQLQQLHRKVAELLESYYRSEISRVYGRLSHHLKEAGEADRLKSFAEKYYLPPYMRAGIIEEAEPSIEEIIEVPLSEESQELAPEVVSCLRATLINSQLYPRDNRVRMDSIESLNECIRRVLENEPTLTVSASGESIILNGLPVDKSKVNIMLARGLASLFSDYGINSITFKRGLRKKELDVLFSFFSKEKQDYIEEAGGFSKLLKKNRIANIKIDEVRYRKASDLAIRSRRAAELFRETIARSQAIGDLFSVGEKGLAINEEILSDPKKAIDLIYNAIRAISKQNISEENKGFMILEGLYKTVSGLAKRDIVRLEREKGRLGELFLSLGAPLRTKVIKESIGYGKDVNDFIIDILSGLNREDIGEILHEGWFEAGILPEELDDFLEIIFKSQCLKNFSYGQIQKLFEEAGIAKEVATKTLDDVYAESFFRKKAKELIDSESSEGLEKILIDNLRSLTEALIIKGDIETIEKLIKSLFLKLKSTFALLRSSAAEAIGRVLGVLLEKEVFDLSASIGAELSERLKTEEDINVYIKFLKDLEMMIDMLIHKRNPSLLVTPLSAIKEEVALAGQRPAGFRSCADQTLNRITRPERMELLLFSFRGKAEKDYLAIIDLMAQFGEKMLDPLMELLSRKDDTKLDPFDIYMKKRHIALMMERIGEKAAHRLKDSLNDKRPFVVKNIIDLFGLIDDRRYLPYLEQATHHPDKEVRKEALSVVKRLKMQALIAKLDKK